MVKSKKKFCHCHMFLQVKSNNKFNLLVFSHIIGATVVKIHTEIQLNSHKFRKQNALYNAVATPLKSVATTGDFQSIKSVCYNMYFPLYSTW